MSNSIVPATIFFDFGNTLKYNANNTEYLYEDSLDTLQVLRQRGYRLGLLSNQAAGTTLPQIYNRLSGLGLSPYIEEDLVVISSEISGNIGKPNQPIFNLALQKAGHDQASQSAIFVTETMGHIDDARSYGWRAILKRNSGTCLVSEGECVEGLNGLIALLPPLGNITNTNFEFAPYPKIIGEHWAVPIDISRITATLNFDCAVSSATAFSVIDFQMGRHTGCPVFDLRQTITAIWLDGVPFDITKAVHHNFGGDTGAELRVLETVLEAGTNHQLRIDYSLDTPQSSMHGSYPPQLSWSSGPSVLCNFGFTDLRPGRYLEAWVPSNLIFDQFELALTVRILNTSINHRLITNGSVTNLGQNQWQVSFPETINSFSTLFELRQTESVTSYIDTFSLPGSGETITIEAWKLLTNGIDLADQINNIKNYLSENEQNIGEYLHGNRFVAFIHQGGMEYEGGTTTSISALKHETYHSWWGRGLKPAIQVDSWMDEAWTTYQIDDGPVSVPFNFNSAAVQLCSMNQWIRRTSPESYTYGSSFWRGIAGYTGVAGLDDLMADFYKSHNGRPVTTAALEEYLLYKTGEPMIADAFHRFVYGFEDPQTIADIWLRDHFDHEGSENWFDGSFWNSPDLWIRNNNDDLLAHQNPVSGQDNWIYARVRNLSTTTHIEHFAIVFNAKPFAGIEFVYPQDFLPGIAAASGFHLQPGATVIVKARWPAEMVPQVGTHTCLLASVFSRSNHPLADKHVWEQNALAQKNLTIVAALPDTWIVVPFLLANFWYGFNQTVNLELIRAKKDLTTKVELVHVGALENDKPNFPVKPEIIHTYEGGKRSELNMEQMENSIDELLKKRFTTPISENNDRIKAEMITSATPYNLGKIFPKYKETVFPSIANARIPVCIDRNSQRFMGLKVHIPEHRKKGERINIELVKRDSRTGKVLGGITLQVDVI